MAENFQIPGKRWIRRLPRPAIFLTYDDGPNPAVTPHLLDLLKKERASATFFVTGEALDGAEAPRLLRRMRAEGHTIGNHGQIHSQISYPGFELMQGRIERACGIYTQMFRSPHGLRTHVATYLQRNRHVLSIHWSRCFEDWLPLDFAKAAGDVREAIVPGAILLLHDGAPSTDPYRDREQVLVLTEMIIAECKRKSIPVAGLASVFPSLHRVRSESERARAEVRATRTPGLSGSLAYTISVLKQWCSSS